MNNTSNVNIIVSDIYGKQIKVIVNETQEAGSYHATWDALGLENGTYFVKIVHNNSIQIRKIVLIY